MQAGAADLDHALPPGQQLRLAIPAGDEVHIGGVAPEHVVAIVLVAQQGRDLVLGARGEQPVLHRANASADLAAVDIVIARYEKEAIARWALGQCRPELILEPVPRQGIFLSGAGKGEVAAEHDKIRHQAACHLGIDETRQCPRHRLGVPTLPDPEMDVGQMQDANRSVWHRFLLGLGALSPNSRFSLLSRGDGAIDNAERVWLAETKPDAENQDHRGRWMNPSPLPARADGTTFSRETTLLARRLVDACRRPSAPDRAPRKVHLQYGLT